MADNQNSSRITLQQGVAIQIVIWIVAALLTYGAMNSRVSVLESQFNQLRSDISDIRSDVKTLLQRR